MGMWERAHSAERPKGWGESPPKRSNDLVLDKRIQCHQPEVEGVRFLGINKNLLKPWTVCFREAMSEQSRGTGNETAVRKGGVGHEEPLTPG